MTQRDAPWKLHGHRMPSAVVACVVGVVCYPGAAEQHTWHNPPRYFACSGRARGPPKRPAGAACLLARCSTLNLKSIKIRT
jgi:hypothetical protein